MKEDPRADLSILVLPVADLEESAGFYGEVLALRELPAGSGSGPRRFAWANGIVLALEAADPGSEPAAPSLRLLLRVDDLRAIRDRLERAGAIAAEDAEGRRLYALDPDGYRLEILEGRGLAPGMVSRSRMVGDRFVLEEEILVAGSPETVWRAFMDQAILSAWLCGGPAAVHPKPGGRLLLTFPHLDRPHTTWKCVIQEYIPPARFKFEEEELEIAVTFDLAPAREGGTLIRLTQTPYDLSAHAEDPALLAQNIALIWRRILRRLALFLEDELDPEFREDTAS